MCRLFFPYLFLQVFDPRVRSRSRPGVATHLGRVLGYASRTARRPDLLRLVVGEEMHVRLPNVHQRDERQDQTTDQCLQSICFQAHF